MKKKTGNVDRKNTAEKDFAVDSPLVEMQEVMAGEEEGGEKGKQEVRGEDLTIDELKKGLDEKKKEYEEIYDRLLRTTADFENFKKRAERERLEHIKFANEDLVRELLPVVDNLERALASLESAKDTEAIRKGIEIVLEQFYTILKKFGLTSYTSVGEKFDPTRHEAVEQVESTEHEANTVIDEFQKGYFLNGRLLRPALVTVTKHPEETLSSD
jgi:molecular chaperone GrpE